MMKFMSEKLKTAAANHIEELIVCCTRHQLKHTGSPIEAMLLEAIMAHEYCWSGKLPKLMLKEPTPETGDGRWTITPQAQIGKFRVDFLIEDLETGLKAVIECDGHNFHERTKEQAKNDRSRDRDLQAKGYLVLRYTGSEIWADPWKCVTNIEYSLYSRMFSEVATTA